MEIGMVQKFDNDTYAANPWIMQECIVSRALLMLCGLKPVQRRLLMP